MAVPSIHYARKIFGIMSMTEHTKSAVLPGDHGGPSLPQSRMPGLLQVSRTPYATFGQRVALPGVGEALKRELAGLVLVDRLLLCKFERCGCFCQELTHRLGGAHWLEHSADFACC